MNMANLVILEHGKFAHLGDFGESHNTGDSSVSDDYVDSGNSGEVVNLVILVILLNLVLFVDFLLW